MGSRRKASTVKAETTFGLAKDNGRNTIRYAKEGHTHGSPNTVDLSDEYVRKDGSLEQITTRSHTQLTDIGTNTHAQIDTAIALIASQVASAYTPTLTNVANLAASTAYSCQYVRLGNTVVVSGRVDVDPTLTATATQLGISLPVASNLANANECAGAAFASAIAGQGAAILGDATNNRAEMNWIAGDISNQPMYFTFVYRIIA